MNRRLVLLIASSALASGCRGPDQARDTPLVERTRRGDTLVVRTIAGSAWGDTARLVPDLRIGSLDGPDELAFGNVAHVAPAPDGSVYVYDRQAVALRQYGSDGRFIRTLGARGQGPGEYELDGGLRVFRDGRVAHFDARRARATIFGPAGEFLETWKLELPTMNLSANAFSVDSAGYAYVLTSIDPSRANQPRRAVLIRVGPGGAIRDTLEAPPEGHDADAPQVLFAPSGHWTLHPHGYVIAGVSDRYSIEVRRPGAPLRIERAVERLAVGDAERADIEKQLAAQPPMVRSYTIDADGKEVPTSYFEPMTVARVKPFYRRLLVGDDGRIWVELYSRAVKGDPARLPGGSGDTIHAGPRDWGWHAPAAWDVFLPDGTYQGVVVAPELTTIVAVSADHAWGIATGRSEEQYVVRLKLVRPGGG